MLFEITIFSKIFIPHERFFCRDINFLIFEKKKIYKIFSSLFYRFLHLKLIYSFFLKYMKLVANKYNEKDVMKIMREWTGLNQAKFGENIGLSKMTIQSYERGVRRFTFETLMKIANKYSYTVIIQKKQK